MKNALQQGQADGMCGLYAVLNFLNLTEWRATSSAGLWYILDACRHFGWLTPQFLTEGYEDYHLKAILDLQLQNYRMSFETFFLSDVASKFPELSSRPLFNRVVSKGGSIIVQNASGGHWLLVTGNAGEPVVFDSADGSGKPIPLTKRRMSAASSWGIVLLPSERPVSSVVL